MRRYLYSIQPTAHSSVANLYLFACTCCWRLHCRPWMDSSPDTTLEHRGSDTVATNSRRGEGAMTWFWYQYCVHWTGLYAAEKYTISAIDTNSPENSPLWSVICSHIFSKLAWAMTLCTCTHTMCITLDIETTRQVLRRLCLIPWPLSHGFSVYLGNGEHNTRTRSVAVMYI